MWNTTSDAIEYAFDDSIAAVNDEGNRVQVSFERARPRTFDLVVGADGLHPLTRHLVFGPEESFARFLGGYLAVFTVPNDLQLHHRMVTFTAPGRTTAVYPVGDASQARVLLLWRTPRLHDYDRLDPVAQRRLIRSMYADLGWEVPRLLARLDQADDLYLDSITQVIMPSWTRGRVALVGDAGYCPGPAVGGGTSLALIGAYILASELARAQGDHVRAFTAYQHAMAPVVAHSRAIGPAAIRLIIPQSRAQISMMAQAMRAIPRLPGPLRRKVTAWGGNVTSMLDNARLTPPHQLPQSS